MNSSRIHTCDASSILTRQFVYEFLERGQFTFVDEAKLLHEEDEVFEWCVEMGLLLQLYDLGEVLVVYVGVDAEQTLQDRLRHREEVAGKRYACNSSEWKLVTTASILCPIYDNGWQLSDLTFTHNFEKSMWRPAGVFPDRLRKTIQRDLSTI